MKWKAGSDKKADPSTIEQHFIPIHPEVHCCRYWKLNEWEYTNMSFPFWRLYYNTISGASVSYHDQQYQLTENNLIIIPPHTSFSTSLKKKATEGIIGKRIESDDEIFELKEQGMVDHLYIHFNLGIHYDYVTPGLYNFELTHEARKELDLIRQATISSIQKFDLTKSIRIYALIFYFLQKIKPENWIGNSNDPRVLKVIEFIDMNYHKKLNNTILAERVAMAPNSLLRLFRKHMKTTIHQYIKQVRINKALTEMHNYEKTIDDIAFLCGFSDRHHFSKVFKQITGLPPGEYRKKKTYR
jgi:AraC-like DNA-binding protein